MSARFAVAQRSDCVVTGLGPVPAGQSPATTQALPLHKLQQAGDDGELFF